MSDREDEQTDASDRDDELAEAIRELARTIDDLRAELDVQGRRGYRPPTPGDALRVADDVAIPAALAVLQANVRALETVQRGITLLRAEQTARDRTATAATETSARAADLRRRTVSQLDAALAEVQRAASEGSLPADDRASDLLAEARALRDEVDRRLASVVEAPDRSESVPYTIEITDGDEVDEFESHVDVDAELESLKDQYDRDRGDAGDGDSTDRDGAPDDRSDRDGAPDDRSDRDG